MMHLVIHNNNCLADLLTSGTCASNEYTCLSGDQCIPLEQVCDQSRNCRDFSDELDCSNEVMRLSRGNFMLNMALGLQLSYAFSP